MGKSIMFIKQNLFEAYAAQGTVPNSSPQSERANGPTCPMGV